MLLAPLAKVLGAGTIECHQGIKELSGPGRQPLIQVPAGLLVYPTPETGLVNGAAPVQVIHADVETTATGYREQPFQRLGFYLNLLEGPLLFGVRPSGQYQ